IDFNGQRVNSDIDAYIDIAGMPTGAATFWALNKLIAEGYITDERPDTKVEFDVSAFGGEAAARVRELAALMMQEAGLALAATDEGGGRFCFAASGLPAPERTARYTLREIDDPTVIKVREDITELQMQILSMAFTPEEVEYMLTPRYWAVVPNLIGLPEEKAAELLRLAGLVPEFIYESAPASAYEDSEHYEDTAYGTVLSQDSPAGCLCEVGGRYFVWVKAQDAPRISEGNIPPELFQYLPGFLGDSGYAEFTLNRDTGIGIPLALRQEGWEVLVHAYGGCLKDEDGAYLYGRVSFDSEPGEPAVYWTPFHEEWDDIPERAVLAYYIYHDGEFVACVGIGLKLISNADGDTLTYSARPVAFGEDTTYNLCVNLLEYVP
ncbi:MAG: PASTA domain-containing protein, partial [Bacillota bacterium]